MKYQRDFNLLRLKEVDRLEEKEGLKRMKNGQFYLKPYNYAT
jgi:hypothetical protein